MYINIFIYLYMLIYTYIYIYMYIFIYYVCAIYISVCVFMYENIVTIYLTLLVITTMALWHMIVSYTLLKPMNQRVLNKH